MFKTFFIYIICPALILQLINNVDKCIYVTDVKTEITVNAPPPAIDGWTALSPSGDTGAKTEV